MRASNEDRKEEKVKIQVSLKAQNGPRRLLYLYSLSLMKTFS
jgi:hypothetical protein